MTRPFLPYGCQSISEADITAVGEALKGSLITRGSHVEAFEKAIADYCGAQFAVAFNSGTTALCAACHAAETTPNDYLITSPNTFAATAIAGMERGATPLFVDIDRSTGNLNLQQAAENLSRSLSRGRYIFMPVHFSGIPVDMEQFDHLNCDPDAMIIEDAAHALGSTYSNGQRVGCCAWSHMTMFSFHPTKTITTSEGGMVTTNDEDLYYRLKRYRNNGIEKELKRLENAEEIPYEGYYEILEMTGNFHFTEIQAALGLSQLQRVDEFIDKRRQLIGTYRQLFKDVPHLRMFSDEWDSQTAFHLCVVQIDFAACGTTRGSFMAQLKEQGIGTQLHYIPLYRHPFISRKSGDLSPYFPEMEAYYAQALSIPLFTDMHVEDAEYVAETIKKALHKDQSRKHHIRSRRR